MALAGCGESISPTGRPAQTFEPLSPWVATALDASPYRNTQPGVDYVGDAACAACHADIAETFAQHPMGRSLAPIAEAETVEAYGEHARNPFVVDRFEYSVRLSDGQVVHRQAWLDDEGNPVAREEQLIAFAIGSGRRGRSYLVSRDGYLFMSPITWYPKKGAWDLSPGYEENNFGFHRVVQEDCLFCHSNRAHLVEDTKNQYRDPMFTGHAIGCERCHGPGELHVHYQEEGGAAESGKLTIVNPARLEPALREAVCYQCHLSGAARVPRQGRELDDFRPGLPLGSSLATYVLRPELRKDRHFVGQVEQMHESRCFEGSGGTLGCISCHDPHVLPAEDSRVAFYRQRCLDCHQSDGCSLELDARLDTKGEDNCIACHMPVLQTDVRHAATSDHRIPRHPDALAAADQVAAEPVASQMPLIAFPFEDAAIARGDRLGSSRDLAIALMQALPYHPEAILPAHLAQLIDPLQQAIDKHANDVPAREALAEIYWKLGRPQPAQRLYESVLVQRPHREHSLVLYARGWSAVGNAARAIEFWEQAVGLDPWIPQYHVDLARAYAQAGKWPEVRRVSQSGLARFPLQFELRQLEITAHLNLGEVEAAQRALTALQKCDLPGQEAILQWFESHPLRRRRTR